MVDGNVVIKKGKCNIGFTLPKIRRIKNIKLKYKFEHNMDTLGWENHMNRLFGFSIGFNPHKNSFSFVYNDLNGEVYAQYIIDSSLSLINMRLYNSNKLPVTLSITEKGYGVNFRAELDGTDEATDLRIAYVPVNKFGMLLNPLYGIKSLAKKDIMFSLK